jgi:hypothetical protein
MKNLFGYGKKETKPITTSANSQGGGIITSAQAMKQKM